MSPTPERRAAELKDLRERFDQHVERIERWLHTWCRRVVIAIALIGVTSTVALAGFGYILYMERKQVKEVCESMNKRHDAAIAALIQGSNQDQANAPTEAAKVEIRRRRDVTISLIDAIAPKVDCDNPVTKGGDVREEK